MKAKSHNFSPKHSNYLHEWLYFRLPLYTHTHTHTFRNWGHHEHTLLYVEKSMFLDKES